MALERIEGGFMNYIDYYEKGKSSNVMRRIKEYGAHSRKQFPPGVFVPTMVCFAIALVLLVVIAVAGPIVRVNVLKDPTLSSVSGKNDDNCPGDGWGDNSEEMSAVDWLLAPTEEWLSENGQSAQ